MDRLKISYGNEDEYKQALLVLNELLCPSTARPLAPGDLVRCHPKVAKLRADLGNGDRVLVRAEPNTFIDIETELEIRDLPDHYV